MGLYIEVPRNKGKVRQIEESDERVLNIGTKPPEWNEVPEGFFAVCVVDNGPFEAAGVAYNERELEEFAYPDGRKRCWLFVPEDVVRRLAPGAKHYLDEE